MAGDTSLGTGTSAENGINNYLIASNRTTEENLNSLHDLDVDEFVIFLQAKCGGFPLNKPKDLKEELKRKVKHSEDIKFIRYTRNGKILAVVGTRVCASEVLKLTNIVGVDIEAFLQFENLTTRFLLYNIPTTVSLAEVATEIEEENDIKVKEIRRFIKRTDTGTVPTETVLVTKLGRTLPEYAKLFFTRHKLRIFVDKPRQCQKCFRFDHNTQSCSKIQKCGNCGENHENEGCNNPKLSCTNCGEEHRATDRKCIMWVKETDLLKFKAENHLTLAEARRRFKGTGESFATIVKKGSQPNPSVITDEIKHIIQEQIQDTRDMLMQVLKEQAEAMRQMVQETLKTVVQMVVTVTNKGLDGNLTQKEIGSYLLGALDANKRCKLSDDGSNSMEVCGNDNVVNSDKFDLIKSRVRKKPASSGS